MLEANATAGGVDASQLWPFSKTPEYAKKWEADRLRQIFTKSLEGMTVHPEYTPASIDTNPSDLGNDAMAADPDTYGKRKLKVLPDWINVNNLDNTNFKKTLSTDNATQDPGKGILKIK